VKPTNKGQANMKSNISQQAFIQAFRDYGRETQFTYEALKVIFDWLEELAECCDDEIELDVIAVCCEFAEYESFKGFQADYPECPECYIETLDFIRNNTTFLELPGSTGFVIQQF
jgi:hypothetical protein